MGGVSWYKLVVYTLLSANGRAYFCKSIAIEMGGVSRYFSNIGVRGRCDSPESRLSVLLCVCCLRVGLFRMWPKKPKGGIHDPRTGNVRVRITTWGALLLPSEDHAPSVTPLPSNLALHHGTTYHLFKLKAYTVAFPMTLVKLQIWSFMSQFSLP